MRVPFTDPCSPYEEFAGVSRQGRRRFIARVRRRSAREGLSTRRNGPLGLVLGAAIAGVGVDLSLAAARTGGFRPRGVVLDDALRRPSDVPFVLLAIGLGGGLGFALANDLTLAREVRREVNRTRCPRCRQSLMGLPIRSRAIGQPDPNDAEVICTECGRLWPLLRLRLSPRDLIPYEQREVPEDVGRRRE